MTPYVYRDKRRREASGELPWCIAYVGLDGRLHRERTRARTRELARQILYKKLEELERARVSGVTPAQPIALKKFVDEEYLPHVLATKTASYYRSNQISARIVCKRLGQALLTGIHSGTVQKYADERAVSLNRSGKRVKPATVNRELMFLSAVFREAVKRRYVERNPVRGIKQLPEDNMIVRWLTDQEEKRLLAFAPAHLRPILLVALHSGMRQGEILGLRWSEVDLDREVIRVVGTKSHKNRFVPMNPVLLSTLRGIAPFVGKQGPCPYVFVNPETETRYETLKKVWASTVRKSGIQNFRFHDLRHTFASRLVQRGASLKAVQDLLGHADLKMTLRYAHLGPSNLRDAVFTLVMKAPVAAGSRGGKRGARRA